MTVYLEKLAEFSALLRQEGLPVGLQETEGEMDLDYCMESHEEEVPYALSNSLGFGGHNVSILLGRIK